MRFDRLFLGGAAVLALAGCTDSSTSGGPELPPLAAGPSVVATEGRVKPSYERAVQMSERVEVGMPQANVEAMFGRPDKAGFEVYGRATPTPWRALVWEYVFEDVVPPRALSIVFQEKSPGYWVVNHGDWPVP